MANNSGFVAAAVVVCLVAVVGMSSAPAHARLTVGNAHGRHLAHVSRLLTSGCSLSAASQCAINQTTCLDNLPAHTQEAVCGCFQYLGSCLYKAGCLNGTNEDLHTNYCETGDQYCCMNHGDFNGCGLRSDFSGQEMCLCEDGFSGNNCNSTSGANCAKDSCNVCATCCKGYSKETCEACVVDECDSQNVCSAVAGQCNTCSKCCKSYLENDDSDCNLCVEHEC